MKFELPLFKVPALAGIFSVRGCSGELTIFVSDLQVFTRERLVQERFDEYQWLKERVPIERKRRSLLPVKVLPERTPRQ